MQRTVASGCLLLGALLLYPSDATGQRRGESLFQRTLDVGAGGSLRVDVPDADIEIEVGGDEVRVEVFGWSQRDGWAQELFELMDFRAEQRGNEVVVRAQEPRVSSSMWRRNHGADIRAVIHVPSRFDLDVGTEDGDVMVDGPIRGTIRLDTSDGDVSLRGAQGPEIRISSSDGDLRIDDVVAETLVGTTSDGDIEASGIEADVEFETSDGDVSVRLARFLGARIRSSDGDIVVVVPTGTGADVDLRAEDVEVEAQVTVSGRLREDRVQGRLGDGGPELVVSSSDGDVTLRSR